MHRLPMDPGKTDTLLQDWYGALQCLGTDCFDGRNIFGSSALHDTKSPDQGFEPFWKAISKLQFKDDLVAETSLWVMHLRLDTVHQVRLALDSAIERDAHFIIIADVSFAHIKDVHFRLGVDFAHQMNKALDGNDLLRVLGNK